MTDFTLFSGTSSQPPLPKDTQEQTFTLSATAGSDIWRTVKAAGGRDDFNGPIYATKVPLKSFQHAAATISADFQTPYAQGGLIIFFPGRSAIITQNEDGTTVFETSPEWWIKTGIEFENGSLFASVVTANPSADWSLALLGTNKATFEVERSHGALWIYVTKQNEPRVPLREVTWVFENENDGREVWIGVAACMPVGEKDSGGGDLNVLYENFSLRTV
ncbi:hypothetical protein PFICI_11075 [Pestalotiopsis fici W106-1]|uniref:Beta-xylosidase C-terminal Concanavalin A-like domain-containing protein n=1 Tax=Pestalotiopsis fici (strain W106-1 / CGMCC3.15140) TaxID=1229662 RepID=W3WWG9_PESFW|nr:uncharacterized protein PFICI_11075 [Pestalotiopsis fici W106-1]ETS77201.1 hypothetical protein PFICI_11075 [Pestalotiopsis fici W106-1]